MGRQLLLDGNAFLVDGDIAAGLQVLQYPAHHGTRGTHHVGDFLLGQFIGDHFTMLIFSHLLLHDAGIRNTQGATMVYRQSCGLPI